MSGKERSRQRVKSFINELNQGTASLTDEEFAMLIRMIVERRDHDAAPVTIAPIDTGKPCSPRSRSSEISFDVRVCMERNDEGRMVPERGQLERSSASTSQLEQSLDGTDQLELPSASTGFETPGQQCLPNWGRGRITAEGCLLVGVRSNLRGNMFFPEELVTGLPKDKKTANEGNKQFDPGGKRGEPPPWKAGVLVSFSFLGKLWAWMPAACVL